MNENQMPKLFGSPSPDIIRKFLLKSKNFFASKTNDAWLRTELRNRLDGAGANVLDENGHPVMDEFTTTESMLLIYQDGLIAGRYPIPSSVQEPVSVPGESPFEREKKMVKWKNDMNLCESQKKTLLNGS